VPATLTPDLLDLDAASLLLVAEVEAYLQASTPTTHRLNIAELLTTPAPAYGSTIQAWNAAHPLPQPTMLDRLRSRRPRLDVTPAQHLDLTSRYIHQHGWCQGQLWDTEGAVCLLGAQLKVYVAGYGTTETIRRARQRIGNTLGRLGHPIPVDTWNDLPATSLTDIHQLLRTAAI